MSDVYLAPRAENVAADTEAILSVGWWQIRPSKPYIAGGQWVQDVWTPRTKFTGAVVTMKLDALPDVPYELYMEIPDGRGGYKKTTEFRIVGTGPVNWEDLVQVSGPGGTPLLPDLIEARLDALEASNPSGPASAIGDITGVSDFAITYLDETTASATRAVLGAAATGAAPTAHTHVATTDLTATGTKNTTTFLRGDNTWAAPPAAGSPAWGDITGKPTTFAPIVPIAQADITNLTADLAAKVGATGATLTNVTLAGTVTAPAASIPTATLSDIVAYMATTWGNIPTIYATSATTWPAGTRASLLPAGYSGALRFDSTAFEDAVSPTVMVAGDRWRRRTPTA